jgi:hypothetical protein
MSTYSNRPKLDINIPADFADFLFEVGEGLTGDEAETWKLDGDSGASWVADPVGSLLEKFAADRFTPPEGRPLRKRWADTDAFALAIQKSSRMYKEGNVMKLFEAAGNLLAEKEVAE